MKFLLDTEEAEKLGQEIADANAIEAPADEPAKRRYGNTLGLRKETHPKLSNRLPREKGALIVAVGDGLNSFERAKKLLGTRFEDKKQFYKLDGYAVNTQAILDAGLDRAVKILMGRARRVRGSDDLILDEKPATSHEVMGAALDFLWATGLLSPRCLLEQGKWLLDGKPVKQQVILKTAYKVVKEQRKNAV